MSLQTGSLQNASIAQNCKALRLPAVGAQFASLAEEAGQRNHSHLHYLEALLQAEMEDRERRSIELRMKEAHLPRIKTLEEFDFIQSPHIPAARIRALAEGGYLERAEPILLVGDPGTGKSHLATGLAIAACRQRRRVRFTTAAALVNQLVEAQRDDYHQAIDLIDRFTCGPKESDAYLELLRIRAEALIRNGCNWRCIEALAEALLEQNTLSGSEAVKIIQTTTMDIDSRAYCDAATQQFGIMGGASDSITTSNVAPVTPPVAVVTNDFGAGYLRGILPGNEIAMDSDGNIAPGNVKLTRNFLSGSADFYMNNSLGLGLQQSYTIGWEYYLTPCPDAYVSPKARKSKPVKPRNLFLALGVSGGFTDERLYHTSSHLQSTILPVSLQGSYVWPGNVNADKSRNPPKTIVSAQIGYTPLLNDLHDYQIYETSSVTIPTGWTNVTVSFTQTDYYLNNAPSSFKRNYAVEGIVLTWAFPRPTPPINTKETLGACYTVDKSSHLFCYDSIALNACIPPSVFRPQAMCGSIGPGPHHQLQ